MKTGWHSDKLGDICVFINRGVSPKYIAQGGVCVLNQKCVRYNRISYDQARRHDIEAKTVHTDRFIRFGDVLVNSTGAGTLGRVAQVREVPIEPTTVDSHITIVRPKPGAFFPDFFGYMLTVIEKALMEAGEGCGGQTELARSVLAENFSVCYPTSFGEQKRIVSILDKAFEGIATAKANAEKNLKNARALFESLLQSVFTQRGVGWAEKRLDEVCQIKPPKAEARSRFSNTDLVSFVPMEDLGINQKIFIPKHVRSLSEVCGSYTYFAEGDILLAKITPCFENGKLGIATNLTNGIGFGSSEYIVFRPTLSVNQEWLYYFLSRVAFRKEGAEQMSGAVGHKRISKEFIEGYLIPVPPLPDQKHITEQLNSLTTETQHLESIYRQKLTALEELKKSLLHQAFSGEL